jgi:hypothetical protein
MVLKTWYFQGKGSPISARASRDERQGQTKDPGHLFPMMPLRKNLFESIERIPQNPILDPQTFPQMFPVSNIFPCHPRKDPVTPFVTRASVSNHNTEDY